MSCVYPAADVIILSSYIAAHLINPELAETIKVWVLSSEANDPAFRTSVESPCKLRGVDGCLDGGKE
jgi:hypothetical protein